MFRMVDIKILIPYFLTEDHYNLLKKNKNI